MDKYAASTQVPVGRSRDEIERTLERFGANGQIWARDDVRRVVTVGFRFEKAAYRLTVSLPSVQDVKATPTGRERSQGAIEAELEQETRRRFRSLANYIKAVLDATVTGILKLEEALLPYQVLPGGSTVYEQIRGQLAAGNAPEIQHVLMNGKEKP